MADPLLTQFMDVMYGFLVYFSWWLIPLLVGIIVYKKWNRFPIEADIYEKRNNNIIKTRDRLGRFFDKATGHTKYRLMKAKDVVDVVPFDCLMHTNYKPTNFMELIINKIRPTIGTVVLFKYGSQQYKPIKNDIDPEKIREQLVPHRDKDNQLLYTYKYEVLDPRDKLLTLNFDVIDWDDINTTMNEIADSHRRRIARRDWMVKFLMPLGMLIVTGFICFLFMYLTYNSDMTFCATNVPAPENPNQPAQTDPKIPIVSDVLPAPGS